MAEDFVGLSGGESFHGAHQGGDRDVRRDQDVDVVGHDYPGVQVVVGFMAVVQGVYEHGCEFGVAEMEGAFGGGVELAVYGGEGLAGSDGGEGEVLGQGAVESPG